MKRIEEGNLLNPSVMNRLSRHPFWTLAAMVCSVVLAGCGGAQVNQLGGGTLNPTYHQHFCQSGHYLGGTIGHPYRQCHQCDRG